MGQIQLSIGGMNISWDDVGRIETPDRVTLGGRSFEVLQPYIDAWKHDPGGTWTLLETGSVRGRRHRYLGNCRPSKGHPSAS